MALFMTLLYNGNGIEQLVHSFRIGITRTILALSKIIISLMQCTCLLSMEMMSPPIQAVTIPCIEVNINSYIADICKISYPFATEKDTPAFISNFAFLFDINVNELFVVDSIFHSVGCYIN